MLPEGINPVIGPDATGVGWVFEYALVDKSGKHNLAELRSFRTGISAMPWNRSRASLRSPRSAASSSNTKSISIPTNCSPTAFPLNEVVNKIRMSNGDVGGKTFEVASTEYYVRGRGYIKSVEDIEKVPLKSQSGTRLCKGCRDRPSWSRHPPRCLRLNGEGEVVGGIIVMRYGENARRVIDGVKNKLKELKGSLPEGVEVSHHVRSL